MNVPEVKPGQIWRSDEKGEEWLVTRTYREVFNSYAMLRKIGGSDDDLLRLKVQQNSEGSTLPGFTLVEG